MRKFLGRTLFHIGWSLMKEYGEWYDDEFYEDLNVKEKLGVRMVHDGLKLCGHRPPKYIRRLVNR